MFGTSALATGATPSALRRVHRTISLVFVLFWIAQATSGLFLAFHRETDDLTLVSTGDRPLNLEAITARIRTLEAERNADASSVFSSTGYSNRYDVHFEDRVTGVNFVVRTDGHGKTLRERPFDAPLLQGGIYIAANRFHRHLLAGDAGAWIVGISGIFLLTNMIAGLKLAWPGRTKWRKALFPSRGRRRSAAAYGWHRALGLWIAPVALIVVASGVLLTFENGTATLLGAKGSERPTSKATANRVEITPAGAVRVALARFPDSSFTGLQIPSGENLLYQVYLRQRSEPNQPEGATRVFVESTSGRIAGVFDPLIAPPADRFISALKPIHTGQITGYLGRAGVFAVGVWLIAMISLGMILWWTRRAHSAARKASSPTTGAQHATQKPI